MVTRRQLGASALAASAAAALASCSSNNGTEGTGNTVPKPSGAPNLTWKGTINMGAQSYTPAVTGVKLAPGSPKLAAFGEVAKQFESLYPGIKIKFLGSEYKYDPNQMRTQAAGGQLPDVWWQQHLIVNASFPEGIATNLLPIMAQPNPFIPGNTKWQDVFNPQIFNQTMADAQTQYVNNGDFVATAFFYNTALFEKAGITAAPTSWAELIQACEKLQGAGVSPSALPVFTVGYSWFCRLFLANYLGLDKLKAIDAYSDAKGIAVPDVAVAWHKGTIDPRKNEAVMAWWPQAKQLYSFFDKAVTQLPKTAPAGAPDYEKLFAAEKVGMVYDGSWLPQTVKASVGDKVKVGSFNFPNLGGSNPLATDFDSSNSVGGPNAAWQYFMSTEKSSKSMAEAGKLEAVTAWMQFFSTPENNAKIVNEQGSFIPTFQGAAQDESKKDIADQISNPLYAIQGGWEFSTEAADGLDALFQKYVLDQISIEDATNEYVGIVEKGFNDYVKEHPIDFTKFN